MILYQQIDYDPANFMCDFGEHAWCQILQSAPASDGRYDIYVADPIATLQTFGAHTHIQTQQHTDTSETDPFELCHRFRHQLLGASVECELPFCGGVVGLFGYDLGRRVESIKERSKAQLRTPDMAVGIYDWALIVDHEQRKRWLVVNHSDAHLYWQQRRNWLMQHRPSPLGTFKLARSWQTNLPFDAYQNAFARIQDYIISGDCYQINLTQQFSCQFQGDIRVAYQRLFSANQAPYCAYSRLATSTVLSLSPERFIALNGQHIETKPIKGTRPRSDQSLRDQQLAQELQNSDKDRAENVMIVDLLRNDIGRVSQPGSVAVPSLFAIESFQAVHHLVSTVTGTLKTGLSAEDLLRACFPGGSITGAPKIRAMEIIETLEPHRRNAYCGAIGYISQNGRMDTNITIRTLVAEDNHLYSWAGGGIIADSIVADEYQECLDKLARILPVLKLEENDSALA
ncbi:aminodeoxychorismate synthase component I [Celerinatantimonas yamalensis]|uniref:aminodeoxychorismate synthase n=1 Tax=Celerinatantimonas yamalensis TaxID=559956 RepID=A0ABW9G2J0_9GAMM